jgi:hypothetical protein
MAVFVSFSLFPDLFSLSSLTKFLSAFKLYTLGITARCLDSQNGKGDIVMNDQRRMIDSGIYFQYEGWIMKQTLVAMMLFLIAGQGASFGQERFQLVSALRTGYGDAAGVSSFTAYGYDSEGNRIDQRVFDGVDSAAALMSSIRYSYDAQKRRVEELLLDAGGDTLSIVRYSYGTEGLLSVSTLRKDGGLQFSDSMCYEGGVLREQRRQNAAGGLTFYNRYGYSAGLLASDSLFESDGAGGFAATQARILSRNTDSTVSNEAQWRVSAGQWYLISTTVMAYAGKNLVSVTTYEGDAVSKRLMDSLAYAVDAYGNRTLEAHFDDERIKTYDIAYIWRDTQQVGVAAGANTRRPGSRIALCNGRLTFGAPVSGNLEFFRIDGRRICEQRLSGETGASLPLSLSTGHYVAMVRGTVNQSLSITIHN